MKEKIKENFTVFCCGFMLGVFFGACLAIISMI